MIGWDKIFTGTYVSTIMHHVLRTSTNIRLQTKLFEQKLWYFTDQNGPKEDHMEMNFKYFLIQKLMLQTVRVEKVDEKMGSFV